MLIYQYENINIVKSLKSISDEMRLRIIRILLRGAFHVNEILFIVNAKQSNISHHLKILQENNIVVSKREGSLIYYRLINSTEIEFISDLLNVVKSQEYNIPFFNEDSKRLEIILQKRKKNAEIFFNSIGKDLDFLQTKIFNEIYDIEEILTGIDKKFKTLLDIGCGTGKNLLSLSKYAEKVIGIDTSPNMLQLSEHICKKNDINFEIKFGDIQNIPYESGTIDSVFINMVLHHISDPIVALKESSRILHDDGYLLLIDLLSHENEKMRDKYADLWLGFSEEELITWLKQSGFIIEEKKLKQNMKKIINNSEKLEVIMIRARKSTGVTGNK